MNEKIKLLAEQASKDNSDGYPVTLEYSNRFAERFAELIIEECMGVVDSCESDLFYDDGMVPIIDVNNRIKEHFGVE